VVGDNLTEGIKARKKTVETRRLETTVEGVKGVGNAKEI